MLTNLDELKDYIVKSNLAHRNFIEGLDRLERSLKLVIIITPKNWTKNEVRYSYSKGV